MDHLHTRELNYNLRGVSRIIIIIAGDTFLKGEYIRVRLNVFGVGYKNASRDATRDAISISIFYVIIQK